MKLRISTILILIILTIVIPLRAELIFLNDGSIIEGEIVKNLKESVTVIDYDSILHEIKRDNILKTRPSIKIGKIYIQKHNGEGISAHIVDENETSYTLRTELNNSNEFIIKKTDILFISSLTPSDVKGFLEADQIYLAWVEPQLSVKHYKVYYSTEKNEKYKLDGITTDNSYILRNISSSKTYYIIVTSIGMDNFESPPSNELIITEKSIKLHPSPPKDLKISIASDDKISLTWEAAESASSRIRGYKIFIYDLNDSIREDGRTTKTEYTIKEYPQNIKQISVKSVDNYGTESEEAVVIQNIIPLKEPVTKSEKAVVQNKTVSPFNFAFSVKPLYTFPLGDLKDDFDYGYGASIGLSDYKFIFNNSILALEMGYLRWATNDGSLYSQKYMLPATISIGYRFIFLENFSLSALFGGGGILIMEKEKNYPVEALFTASMNLDFIFSENHSFFIGGGFYSIYERDKKSIDKKNKFKNFTESHIGISFKLL